MRGEHYDYEFIIASAVNYEFKPRHPQGDRGQHTKSHHSSEGSPGASDPLWVSHHDGEGSQGASDPVMGELTTPAPQGAAEFLTQRD